MQFFPELQTCVSNVINNKECAITRQMNSLNERLVLEFSSRSARYRAPEPSSSAPQRGTVAGIPIGSNTSRRSPATHSKYLNYTLCTVRIWKSAMLPFGHWEVFVHLFQWASQWRATFLWQLLTPLCPITVRLTSTLYCADCIVFTFFNKLT